MKKTIFFLVFMITALASQLFPQPINQPTTFPDSSFLKKYIISFLYTGSGKNYYSIQNTINLRLGVSLEAPLTNFSTFFMRAYYEPVENGNRLKAEGRLIFPEISIFTVSVGAIPNVSREFHTPNPITPESQFIPGAKAVISPGIRPGIKLNTKNIYLGAYVDGKNAFQYHLGYSLENFGPVKSLKVSAFILGGDAVSDTLSGGGALTVNLTGISLTAYSEKMAGINTHSFFTKVNISESLESYASLVYKNKDWQSAEIGVLQSASQKIGPLPIKYCYGVGYQYYPYKAINFYMQTWLN